jgi:hypothetical protein
MNRKSRILLATGLVMTSSITLIRDYVALPDYVRGFLAGIGLGLIIWGLILQRKSGRKTTAC